MTSPTQPIRIVALISGGGRTVQNLVQRTAAGELAGEIVQVVASRDCAGVPLCREAGLPVQVVRRRDYPSVEAFSAALDEVVLAVRPDLVCLAGFLSLWQFPDSLDGKVMNIHPALLPSFGGPGMHGHHVHEAVLRAGCKVSGVTVHFCDHQYDAGPIIVQKCVPVLDGDTPDSLAARVFKAECQAYPEAINLFAAGRLRIEGGVVRVSPAE